jgi:hypothetical protein
MSDQPTRDTDVYVHSKLANGAFNPAYVEADFARKLERQRDEARELVRELQDALELALEHAEPGIWVYSDDPKKETLLRIALASTITKSKEVLL